MDMPGVRQVPEGSGEQGKMEKIGCKIIYGAPTTLAVKRLITLTMTFSYSHPPHPTHTPSLSWSCLPFIRSGQNHLAHGTVKVGRRQGRQRNRWEDNIRNGQAWSSQSPRGQWKTGKKWRKLVAKSCGAPTTLAVKGLMMMMMAYTTQH